MMIGAGLLRRTGLVVERVSDTWLVQTLLGDPFTPSLDLWLNARREAAQRVRRRVYIDAAGNVTEEPRTPAS